MAILDTYELADYETLPAISYADEKDLIAQRSAKTLLNKEVIVRERFDGQKVYSLGKTAIETNHWLGLIRLGGFHLIYTDIQNIRGPYPVAIARQLALASRLSELNPLFTNTLKEDLEETGQIMSNGYLFTDIAGTQVIDYLFLTCEDRAHRRMAIHPDSVNEHVFPDVRDYTIQVARTVINI